MNPAASLLAAPLVQPIAWRELVAHRAYLVRFARRRLKDPALAEDAVHDVFEAVLAGRAAFGGRAALRSWLTSVLRHKIVDLVRRAPACESLDDEDGAATAVAHARACPQPRPDERAEQRERLRGALERIEAMPASLREAMRLRVLEERDTAEVCRVLAISEDNLFVRLHRARRQLAA